jgi:hypothetical protein
MQTPAEAAAALAASRSRRNALTALVLFGFSATMYYSTTNSMKTTDVLADLGGELDQVRKMKKEAGSGGK